MKPIASGSDFSTFRSARAKLFWSCQTCPDISCSVALLAQVTEEIYLEEREKHIKKLNSVVSHLEKNPKFILRYPKLDKDSLHISVYSNASYCSNTDGSSQLGYIILLTDKDKKISTTVLVVTQKQTFFTFRTWKRSNGFRRCI